MASWTGVSYKYGGSGLTGDRVRAILAYSSLTENDKVTYHFVVGGHGYGAYSTTAALSTSLSCSGQTTYTTSGQGGNFSNGTNVWLNPTSGNREYSWYRTTSAQTRTVNFSLTSTGSTISGTSSGSLTITIPALPTYTVKYNANGGSGAPSSQTKTYDKTLTLSKTKPTRTGYTFSHWDTKSDGSGTNYSPGGSYTKNAAVTLYARWSVNSYTLTYNANGGSVSPTSKSINYGSTYGTLPTPTRTGYDCSGWYTAASGGTEVTASTTMGAANKTIYAHWQPKTYTLTANANGGSIPSTSGWSGTGDTATKTITYASTYGALPTPTRTYYAFLGWYTATSEGTKVTNNTPVSTTGNKTIYAQWERTFIPPTLTISKVTRAIDKGSEATPRYVDDDSGTVLYVDFSWTTGVDGNQSVAYDRCDIIITNKSNPNDSMTIINNIENMSRLQTGFPTTTLNTSSSYTIQFRLYINNNVNNYPEVTRTDYISPAYFIIDINADGTAIGFGTAVQDNAGFYCNMDAYFADFSGIMRNIFNIFYPKGSYYETDLPYQIPSGSPSPTDSDLETLGITWFDPNYAWGGTWVLEEQGKVHVGAGSTYFAGTEYGSNTHTHTTGDFTLLAKHLPAHTHGSKTVSGKFRIRKVGNDAAMVFESTNFTVSDYSGTGAPAAAGSGSYKMSQVEFEQSHTHTSVGGDTAHNHGATGSSTRNSWQPSIAVNRWHRTA